MLWGEREREGDGAGTCVLKFQVYRTLISGLVLGGCGVCHLPCQSKEFSVSKDIPVRNTQSVGIFQ